MEFEDVSAEVQWEARRVAAAFGVEVLIETEHSTDVDANFEGYVKETLFSWFLKRATVQFASIHIQIDGVGYIGCYQVVCYDQNQWVLEYDWAAADESNLVFNEIMAHGLYRLGFTDESVLSQLPSLSMHEQMEARLSLPREFWPQKWLEEN